MSDTKDDQSPNDAEKLIAAIFSVYQPCEKPEEADEFKTSIELMEEIEAFAGVAKYEVFHSMEEAGFKYTYTGSGFTWLLKLK